MRYLPSAEVVSYSNAGIVVATLISIFFFGERADWRRRVFGATVIVGGLAVMAI
jgi:drug/metabolite transporter (DMT)-like permease